MGGSLTEILVIGYGNPDRQDDGVAWHVIDGLAHALGSTAGAEREDELILDAGQVDLLFQLQLTPELAEVIAAYPFVCFVDAHTGAVKEDLHIETLTASYQTSPFTHHMTPQTCLSIAESLFQHHLKEAVLLSIRGYAFEFTRDLSDSTRALSKDAIQFVLKWIDEKTASSLLG
jgi:hydrogenase maturation protease